MPLDLGSLPLTTGESASKAALNTAAREYLGWFGDPVATLTRWALGAHSAKATP